MSCLRDEVEEAKRFLIIDMCHNVKRKSKLVQSRFDLRLNHHPVCFHKKEFLCQVIKS